MSPESRDRHGQAADERARLYRIKKHEREMDVLRLRARARELSLVVQNPREDDTGFAPGAWL